MQRQRGWVGPVLMAVGTLLATVPAGAAPTSRFQAAQAVEGWLGLDAAPMGATLGWAPETIETHYGTGGAAAYYIVYLEPTGFVIVAADDRVEPIVGFVEMGDYDPAPDNPLGALVDQDVPGRVAAARAGSDLELFDSGAGPAPPTSKWQYLWDTASTMELAATGTEAGVSSISDVRVASFVQSRWNQTTVCSQNVYNYYTPNNWPCGCVATAMAQLLRYHEHPGSYNWSSMDLVPGCSTTLASRQAIGELCSDAGLAVNMNYGAGGSGADTMAAATAFTGTFGYSNAVKGYNSGSNIGAGLNGMINPNLDAALPVLLGITGTPGGHAIVADGYGYNASTLYHHLNMGWGGYYDAWYNLPTIDSGSYVFTSVYKTVYNVFQSETGEIISGRVTSGEGTALSGATVTGTGTGGPFTDTTDSSGIYALVGVGSGGTYTVSVSKTGYSFDSQSVTVGTSTTYGNTAGNRWGIDFEAAAATVTTSKSSYTPDEPITVSFTGASGVASEWVGLFPDGGAKGSFVTWLRTDGTRTGTADITSGSVTFSDGLGDAGDYEARYYIYNGGLWTEMVTDFSVALTPDTYEPQPNPPTWAVEPYSSSRTAITMQVNTVTDVNGVRYYFQCTSGGGADSGWQESATYTDSSLTPGNSYAYRVKARDLSSNYNETDWATTKSARTVWTGKSSYTPNEPIVVNFANLAGNQYEWVGLFPEGGDAGSYLAWLRTDGTTTGTTDVTSGSVTFGAGLADTGNYEARLFCYEDGAWRTLTSGFAVSTGNDTYAPTPDPMTWSIEPRHTARDEITMVAGTASDVNGVQYYFECVSGGGNDSDWQDSASYTDTGLTPGNTYVYRVKARDKSANNNETSTSSSATARAVWTAKSSYTPSEPITVNFANVGGSSLEWIGLFPSGGGAGSYEAWKRTDGTTTGTSDLDSGSVTFSSGISDTGDYEARLCYYDSGTWRWAAADFAVSTSNDTYAPTPDPMTFAVEPYSATRTSIGMTATTATDVNGVEYYFECVSGGGADSGWQDSASYTDTGLTPGNTYAYRVKARDKSVANNETGASTTTTARTVWTSKSSYTPSEPITVNFANLDGNQYEWVGLFPDGGDAGSYLTWLRTDGTTTGTPGTTSGSVTFSAGIGSSDDYDARLRYYDGSAWRWAVSEFAVSSANDTYAPTPDPMTFAGTPYTNGSGSVTMTATTASDVNGVQYYFECVSGGGTDSGWQDSATYTDTTADTSGSYSYRVKARDQSANNNETSASDTATARAVWTAKSSYTPNEPITVNFANVAGHAWEWIGLFPDGGGNGAYETWLFTSGTRTGSADITSGSVTFSNGLPDAGDYDVRLCCYDDGAWRMISGDFSVSLAGDTYPPAPDPMSFSNAPISNGRTSITMTATSASDVNGVQYYFDCVSGGGADSGWQDGATYTDSGLTPGNTYVYRVKARDKSANNNETGYSSSATATTFWTGKASYSSGETVVTNFTNLPGVAAEWIGIYQEGGARNNWYYWLRTDGTKVGTPGTTDGSVSFPGGVSSPGNYEARLHVYRNGAWSEHNSGFTVVAEGETLAPPDLVDIARLGRFWMQDNCSAANNGCDGADRSGDGQVNLRDLPQ